MVLPLTDSASIERPSHASVLFSETAPLRQTWTRDPRHLRRTGSQNPRHVLRHTALSVSPAGLSLLTGGTGHDIRQDVRDSKKDCFELQFCFGLQTAKDRFNIRLTSFPLRRSAPTERGFPGYEVSWGVGEHSQCFRVSPLLFLRTRGPTKCTLNLLRPRPRHLPRRFYLPPSRLSARAPDRLQLVTCRFFVRRNSTMSDRGVSLPVRSAGYYDQLFRRYVIFDERVALNSPVYVRESLFGRSGNG